MILTLVGRPWETAAFFFFFSTLMHSSAVGSNALPRLPLREFDEGKRLPNALASPNEGLLNL